MNEATMPRPGSIALVTGASSGIGAATAQALAALGCRVICAGRRADRVEEVAAGLGDKGLPLVLDVTDPASIDGALASLSHDWREIAILVNNAGGDKGGRERFDQGDIEDWVGTIETNVTGLIRITYAVISGMIERDLGHIVNIGSVSGFTPYAGGTIYAGSKYAVHGFSESLRKDYRGTGIRVTEVLPGLVRTEFAFQRWEGDPKKAQKFYDDFGECLVPEDIANTIAFAVSQPPNVVISQLVVLPNAAP
jgi:3-hydroxy acid dehydrogenase / malonic semialdehyde reductase